MNAFRRFLIAICAVLLLPGMARAVPASLYMSDTDLARVQGYITNQTEPFYANYQLLVSRANSALGQSADPFFMNDITAIKFGWCQNQNEPDDSLKDLTVKLEKESDRARSLALAWLLTGDSAYADKALLMIKAWASGSSLLNLYDLNINFSNSTFNGMTTDGYCGLRPWNMALDTTWQCYGLINFSDTYIILKRNGHAIPAADDQLIRNFLLELTEAVNSGLHAWTRWADAHPGSSVYERYRSDNHLSWCLAGLIAGAVALDDNALAQYVLTGAPWNDSRAGTYANPSSIRSVIDYAIESGTGAANEGRIHEEKILRNPPVYYALFHLWAMSLVAEVAEAHFSDDVWSYEGSDGGGMRDAFDRYAAHLLGERASPRPTQDNDMTGESWIYEFAHARWATERFEDVVSVRPRNKFVQQGIGPVILLAGRAFGFAENRVAKPVISPAGGGFIDPVAVTLSTPTPGAAIHYTVDGSTPTGGSTLYSTAFPLALSSTVKAIAIKDGMTASPVAEAAFSVGELTSTPEWQSHAIDPQEGVFQVSFEVVPSGDAIDGVTGLGPDVAGEYDDLGPIVLFYTNGKIRARNGGVYASVVEYSYEANVRYGVRMVIDVPRHLYSVYVTPEGESEFLLAEDYAFRTSQSSATNLSYLSARSLSGSHTVSAITYGPLTNGGPPEAPTNLRVVR